MNKIQFKVIIERTAFTAYSAVMFWELFLGNYRTFSVRRSANLIPFKTVYQYIAGSGRYNAETLFINLAANIVVFIPLGFFLPLLKRCFRKFKLTVMLCGLVILAAECIQYVFNVGIFDIDDLILNLLGCIAGYGIYKTVAAGRK